MKNLYFTKGPLLCAHFFTNSELIYKVKLSRNPEFQAIIEGPASSVLIELINQWLTCYMNNQQPKPLPLEFTKLPPFQKSVLRSLEKIPSGQTLSYKDLATLSKSPKASRAVGTA